MKFPKLFSGKTKAQNDSDEYYSKVDMNAHEDDEPITLGEHFTGEQLELIAEDLRYFAEESFQDDKVVLDIARREADLVQDGGTIKWKRFRTICAVIDNTKRRPYFEERGGDTPLRQSVIEKMKELVLPQYEWVRHKGKL